MAERFCISHRQAQRDFEYLRRELGAPIAYDNSRKGFYYEESYVLPVLLSSDNDDLYIPEIFNVHSKQELAADESIIQMQIPYSATIEIKNKLTALELSNYIVAREPHDRYVCEFHSVEKFLGMLLSMDADFRIVEPYWLREKILRSARRVVENNKDSVKHSKNAHTVRVFCYIVDMLRYARLDIFAVGKFDIIAHRRFRYDINPCRRIYIDGALAKEQVRQSIKTESSSQCIP